MRLFGSLTEIMPVYDVA